MWIKQKTEEEIITYAKEMYNNVLNGRVDKLDLVKRSRVKQNRLTVKCKCRKRYEVEYLRKLLKIVPDALCEKDTCNKLLKNCTTVKDKKPTYGSGIAGVLYYNEHVKPSDKITDSFYHMKCNFQIHQKQTFTNWNGDERRAAYIAVRNLSELEEFNPDWIFLAESEVLKKVKPVFEAMEWDISKIRLDDKQKNLEEWF